MAWTDCNVSEHHAWDIVWATVRTTSPASRREGQARMGGNGSQFFNRRRRGPSAVCRKTQLEVWKAQTTRLVEIESERCVVRDVCDPNHFLCMYVYIMSGADPSISMLGANTNLAKCSKRVAARTQRVRIGFCRTAPRSEFDRSSDAERTRAANSMDPVKPRGGLEPPFRAPSRGRASSSNHIEPPRKSSQVIYAWHRWRASSSSRFESPTQFFRFFSSRMASGASSVAKFSVVLGFLESSLDLLKFLWFPQVERLRRPQVFFVLSNCLGSSNPGSKIRLGCEGPASIAELKYMNKCLPVIYPVQVHCATRIGRSCPFGLAGAPELRPARPR